MLPNLIECSSWTPLSDWLPKHRVFLRCIYSDWLADRWFWDSALQKPLCHMLQARLQGFLPHPQVFWSSLCYRWMAPRLERYLTTSRFVSDLSGKSSFLFPSTCPFSPKTASFLRESCLPLIKKRIPLNHAKSLPQIHASFPSHSNVWVHRSVFFPFFENR